MPTINKNKVHKILVVRTDRMGDVLLNIPAIRALKQDFGCALTALIRPEVKQLLAGFPEIDQLLEFDERKWKTDIWFRFAFLGRLRRMNFDLAVILNPSKRFHLLSFLAGIGLRLGYERKWGFLLTHKIKDEKFKGAKHEVEYNLDLVRSIGADTKDKKISLATTEEDRQFVDELMTKYNIRPEEQIVAIHPASSNPAKCWPKENFSRLCDDLQERRLKVAIIGGTGERAAAIKLKATAQYPPINLCGKFTLGQLAVFLQRCAVLVSNDSGPVHIAAAMNTPTVVIFSRNIPGTGPKRWGPWGQGHIILHKDPGCNPCLDRACPYDFKCLSAITPEEVLDAVERQLAHSS